LAFAAVPFATPALAQAAPRNASSEAFSFCREQEKLGDARACWSVWLQKYRRTSSNEAETAYAEAYPATHARLRLTSTPSAALTLDGRPLGTTPRDGVEVAPGEHRITFVSEGRSEGRTITVGAGEVRDVDVMFDAPPIPAARPADDVPPSARGPSGEVLDFCALPSKEGTRKERVVLFAPSGTSQVNDDAEVRAVDGARLVRDVFTARFATGRFHNVLASFAGKRGWEEQPSLSLAEVRAFSREARNEGRVEHDARVEREKPFIAYSLECADYVVVPSIRSHETKPKELSLGLGGALGVFRREGEWFKRIALLSATVPASADVTSDVDRVATARTEATVLPKHISAVPDPKCVPAKATPEGLAACGTKGEGTVEQARGGLDERLGAVCTKARAGSTPDDERSSLSVQCEVRTRAYELARALQEDSRKVDGWHLFGVVAHRESPASFSLGRDEGVKVGDAFEVRDGRNERVAFFKAVRIGPGGAAGEQDHSLLVARSGEAPEGARVDAYPQLGLVIAPYASFALLTYSYGTTRVRSGSAFQDFTLPEAVFGGGATLGYDLSSLLGWTETYARVGAGVFVGSGLNTSATLVPLDLWFEKGFYLARRLSLAAAIGGTLQLTSVNVLTAIPPIAEDLHVASTMVGPAARLGLDVMLHPDWSLKVEAAARVPLNSASYTEADGKTVPAEWLSRDDHFATIAANLGIAKTF
jgi:hypothetical protein